MPAKKTSKKNKTVTITYKQPTYKKATKTMPPMLGNRYIFTMSCDADVVKALNAFQKDFDMETRAVACRVALKRFLRSEGYLK